MTIFERIEKISKKRGMSLREVNTKAKLGTNAIYRWKNQNPSIDKVESVANVLGVTVDYLLGKNETPDWANKKDTYDLEKFLEDNDGTFTYGGDDLTEDEKQKLKIAMTQIFWDRHKHD
ncbi:helix-turn-helix domain-containing protein [Pediococcus pentosaceus]|uniref:helix-turn-helix domain-containing protein n=1 Tax=Pediococcus pentosaceus TaxID=1255 RepID=UPI0020730C24|nr:helix-turn-helix transcriptional regulator [Pediococcus pentosaceus]MCM6819806.1 helix-turn-helix domain-containing protein [Pediococcus pentosaceus]